MKEVFSIEQNKKQSNTDCSERLPYIDIMKGIGIFLVVYAHVIIADTERFSHVSFLIKYVYAFHMQLFFFITGYCLGVKHQYNQNREVKKLLKRLLIPYFLWSILYLFLGQVGGAEIKERLYAIISLRGIAPLWFLAALFLVEVGFYFVHRLVKNRDRIWFILIVGSFALMEIIWKIKGQYGKEILNVSLLIYYILITCGRFLANFAMLCSGYLFVKKYKQKLKWRNNWIMGITCLGIMLMLVKMFPNSINLHTFEIASPLLFIVTSYLGTLGIYFVSHGVKRNIILEKLGKNSLGIMILHYQPFATMKYASILTDAITNDPYIGVLLATIFSLMLCMVGIFFCTKKLFIC